MFPAPPSVPILHFLPRCLCLMTPVAGSLGKGDSLASVSPGFSRNMRDPSRAKGKIKKHLQVGAHGGQRANEAAGSWNEFPGLSVSLERLKEFFTPKRRHSRHGVTPAYVCVLC